MAAAGGEAAGAEAEGAGLDAVEEEDFLGSAVDCWGTRRLDRSSPSSASMAITLPTGMFLEPSGSWQK